MCKACCAIGTASGTKRYRDWNRIDFVQSELKGAAAGRYFMHVVDKMSPDRYGEPFDKPGVFIRVIRTDQCPRTNSRRHWNMLTGGYAS